MKMFEYKIILMRWDEMEKRLTDYGQEGWRVIHVEPANLERYRMFLEREVGK